MNFPPVGIMEFMKEADHSMIDLASSGIRAPESIAQIGIDLNDAPIATLNPYGYPPLRRFIADRFGVRVENVAISPGASMANFMVLTLLLDKGDEAVVETPAYEPFFRMVEGLTGRESLRLHRQPASGYHLDPFLMPDNCRPKVVVTTNPHNPTGIRASDDIITELAERAGYQGGWLLVDEIFRPLISGEEWSTTALLHKNIIAIGSLTKAWGLAGLRIGWVIAPETIIKRIHSLMNSMHAVQSIITEFAALKILQSGCGDRLLADARVTAKNNWEITHQFLSGQNKLSWTIPDGGIITLVRFNDHRPSEDFCALLREKFGVLVTPGAFFEVADGFRLGFGAPAEELKRGLQAIHEALELID